MKKRAILIPCAIVAGLAIAVATPFAVLGVRTAMINSDYDYLKNDATYGAKAEIQSLNLVTQHISCGYATIEMMSDYYGNKVTEDDLNSANQGAISTSSSDGFLVEARRSISGVETSKYSYLKNDELLKKTHDSIKNGNPVALEWAAQYEGEWTLHFSLVSGMDLSNDRITVYNPYGYIESISSNEFIDRTSFQAYSNMPIFLSFGFAFGAFEKNTIFVPERIA